MEAFQDRVGGVLAFADNFSAQKPHTNVSSYFVKNIKNRLFFCPFVICLKVSRPNGPIYSDMICFNAATQ